MMEANADECSTIPYSEGTKDQARQNFEESLKKILLEDIEKKYELPLKDVADSFGVSLTMMKQICRYYKIKRWPHRQIKSITKTLDQLKDRLGMVMSGGSEAIEIQRQILLTQQKKILLVKMASRGLNAEERSLLFMSQPGELESLISANQNDDLSEPTWSEGTNNLENKTTDQPEGKLVEPTFPADSSSASKASKVSITPVEVSQPDFKKQRVQGNISNLQPYFFANTYNPSESTPTAFTAGVPFSFTELQNLNSGGKYSANLNFQTIPNMQPSHLPLLSPSQLAFLSPHHSYVNPPMSNFLTFGFGPSFPNGFSNFFPQPAHNFPPASENTYENGLLKTEHTHSSQASSDVANKESGRLSSSQSCSADQPTLKEEENLSQTDDPATKDSHPSELHDQQKTADSHPSEHPDPENTAEFSEHQNLHKPANCSDIC